MSFRRAPQSLVQMNGKEDVMAMDYAVPTAEAREEARRHVRRKRIFYTVLGVWVSLSLMWFTIDLLDDSSSWWFYWPMLGTGIGVAITGVVLLGRRAPRDRRALRRRLGAAGDRSVPPHQRARAGRLDDLRFARGPGTRSGSDRMPPPPRIARRTLPLLEAPSGVIVVAMAED
jgi:hypothetical protein